MATDWLPSLESDLLWPQTDSMPQPAACFLAGLVQNMESLETNDQRAKGVDVIHRADPGCHERAGMPVGLQQVTEKLNTAGRRDLESIPLKQNYITQ